MTAISSVGSLLAQLGAQSRLTVASEICPSQRRVSPHTSCASSDNLSPSPPRCGPWPNRIGLVRASAGILRERPASARTITSTRNSARQLCRQVETCPSQRRFSARSACRSSDKMSRPARSRPVASPTRFVRASAGFSARATCECSDKLSRPIPTPGPVNERYLFLRQLHSLRRRCQP